MPFDLEPIRAIVTLDKTQFSKGLKDLDKQGKKSGNSVLASFKKVRLGALAASAAITATAGVLLKLSRDSIRTAAQIGDVADAIGFSAQQLQEFRFAAETVGLAANTTDQALQRFSRRIGEAAVGTGEAKDALKELGISLFDESGALRANDVLLTEVADSLSQVTEEQDRLRLAFKLFDSEGARFVAVLRNGGDALTSLREEARETGAVLEDEMVRRSQELNAELDKLQKIASTQLTEALVSLGPVLVELAEFAVVAADAVASLVANFEELENLSARRLAKEIEEAARRVKKLEEIFNSPGGAFVVAGSLAQARERLEELTAEKVRRTNEDLADDLNDIYKQFTGDYERLAGKRVRISEDENKKRLEFARETAQLEITLLEEQGRVLESIDRQLTLELEQLDLVDGITNAEKERRAELLKTLSLEEKLTEQLRLQDEFLDRQESVDRTTRGVATAIGGAGADIGLLRFRAGLSREQLTGTGFTKQGQPLPMDPNLLRLLQHSTSIRSEIEQAANDLFSSTDQKQSEFLQQRIENLTELLNVQSALEKEALGFAEQKIQLSDEFISLRNRLNFLVEAGVIGEEQVNSVLMERQEILERALELDRITSSALGEFGLELDRAVEDGLFDGLRDGITSFLQTGNLSDLGESLKESLARSIINAFAEAAASGVVSLLFGGGGGSQVGGLLSSALGLVSSFSGFGGGSSVSGGFSSSSIDFAGTLARNGGLVTPQGVLRMATGGLVPNLGRPFADSVPALLMPGERVLTRDENKDFEKSSGAVTINFTANVNSLDPRTAAEMVVQQADTIEQIVVGKFQRNGPLRQALLGR